MFIFFSAPFVSISPATYQPTKWRTCQTVTRSAANQFSCVKRFTPEATCWWVNIAKWRVIGNDSSRQFRLLHICLLIILAVMYADLDVLRLRGFGGGGLINHTSVMCFDFEFFFFFIYFFFNIFKLKDSISFHCQHCHEFRNMLVALRNRRFPI